MPSVSCSKSSSENVLSRAEALLNGGDKPALLALLKTVLDEQARWHKERSQLQEEKERLKLRVDRLTRMLFGRKSERLRPEDLAQLALAFGASEEEAHSGHPLVPRPEMPEEKASEPSKKKKRRHPGRTRLAPELERIVTESPVPEEERTCTVCGQEMTCFGHLDHERVEYVPAKLVVHVERREKLGCQKCKGDAVTAERLKTPSVPRRAGASLLAKLIEEKCDDALPIHRQRDQLLRLGFDIPANTLYGYFAYALDLLQPVAEATLSRVLGDPVVVALDDTTLKVLDKKKASKIYRGHLWCFTHSGPLVAYAFTETWRAEDIVPWIFAIPPGTYIQCDDYKGYGSRVRFPDGEERILVPPERRLGCSMHVRRRFHEALRSGDERMGAPVGVWKDIYALEALAKSEGLDAEGRGALRQERSLPLLDAFDSWVDAHEKVDVPSALLTKATGYAKHQRPYIRRCFEDGRLEIDNGHTERMIREPALGRKNYLFTGSTRGAERLACGYTLVQSCRNLKIPTREYLIDVIEKMEDGWPLSRLSELVPDRWAELHRPNPE